MSQPETLAERPPEHAPWTLVLMLGGLTALGPLAIDMYLPGLPSVARTLHATPSETSATLAAFFFGLGVGQFVYGPLSDRIGRRGPLIFGVATYIIGALLCALAPNVWVLMAARLLQALGGSAGQVVARASVRDRFSHQMAARVLSLLILVLGLAPIIAPIIGSYMLLVGDWRLIFWFQASVAIVILTATVLGFRESRTEEMRAHARGESTAATFRYLLSHPRVVGYTLAGAFNSGAFFSWISLSPNLLIQVDGVAPANFGWWFGANAAGFIGMSQVNAHLMHTRTPEDVLMKARLASVVSAVVLMIDAWFGIGGMLGVIIPLYVTLGSFGLVGPNTQAAAMNVDPGRAGSISSIVGGVTFGMGAIISSVSGFLHDGTPRPLAALILVMILASSAALYGLAKPNHAHAHAA
ncbi:MAG TPA: multidrug effflux MFS transporter [Caulobacteraceae bacterium]|jgi:DHA1 family bicyclomycin/chloramphenicol resistance-like MFS transporter